MVKIEAMIPDLPDQTLLQQSTEKLPKMSQISSNKQAEDGNEHNYQRLELNLSVTQ